MEHEKIKLNYWPYRIIILRINSRNNFSKLFSKFCFNFDFVRRVTNGNY